MTQTKDILKHLQNGETITQRQAILLYGAYRLSGIIYNLRKRGYDIVSIDKEVPTRYKKSNGQIKMTNIVEYKYIKNETK
tara:strand:+ start:938 stop:1177 length:240 start_codon:yes stop_codon:yes gene_type:complete